MKFRISEHAYCWASQSLSAVCSPLTSWARSNPWCDGLPAYSLVYVNDDTPSTSTLSCWHAHVQQRLFVLMGSNLFTGWSFAFLSCMKFDNPILGNYLLVGQAKPLLTTPVGQSWRCGGKHYPSLSQALPTSVSPFLIFSSKHLRTHCVLLLKHHLFLTSK